MFTPDQQYHLMSKLGYEGPKAQDEMNKYLTATPEVAARMGRLAQAAAQRQETQKSNVKMYNQGGLVGGTDGQQHDLMNWGLGPHPATVAHQEQQAQTTTPTADTPTGTTQDHTEGLNELYNSVLGRDVDESGLSHYSAMLNSGEHTMDDIAKIVAQSDEGKAYSDAKATYFENDDLYKANQEARNQVAHFQQRVADATEALNANPDDPGLQAVLNEAQAGLEAAQNDATVAQANFDKAGVPSAKELVAQGLFSPESLVHLPNQTKIEDDMTQYILDGSGQAGEVTAGVAAQSGPAAQATDPTATDANTYTAQEVKDQVTTLMDAVDPATGEITKQIDPASLDPQTLAALGLSAAQIEDIASVSDFGELNVTPQMIAQAATLAGLGAEMPASWAAVSEETFTTDAATFTSPTPSATAADTYNLSPTQSAEMGTTAVENAAKLDSYPGYSGASTDVRSSVDAAVGSVTANELVDTSNINADPTVVAQAVQATAATMDTLNAQAVASAAQGTFSQQAYAKAAQGDVTVKSTVQGQLDILMRQFDNGTPAWAAGAMRAANAAMAARGMGGSSLAGAAIVQAAMEAAVPIAQADALVFERMNMANLDNRQQVAIANAAASQQIELQNLNNAQQAALQNSMNAFNLQTQSLSNEQAVVLANQAVKQAMTEKSFDANVTIALANAGKYSAINAMNLTSAQQSAIAQSANNLQIDLANLSNEQQAGLSTLQIQASLLGQELSNEQQVAMLTSTQNFSAAQFNATNQQQAFMQDAMAQAALEGQVLSNEQQTALFNVSNVMQERGQELTNEQQTRIFNTTNNMQMEVTNMSNRQQTALANAQIEAAIRGQELSGLQQSNIVNAERIAEIAGINFTSKERVALANADIMKTVDLANLNTKNAKVLADAAALTQVDMTNLNNRQQSQVENARNFLQMDLANLSNTQQTTIFKNQQIANALLSDQAAVNVAEQFGAAAQNQIDMFFSDLSSNISRFNAEQVNILKQSDTVEYNKMSMQNTALKAAREEFNAANSLLVSQFNANWRQEIASTEFAAEHEAAMEAARTANGFTMAALDAVWQNERDIMAYAWQSAENEADRYWQTVMADKQINAAEDAQNKEALGYIFGKFLFGGDDGGILGGLF